VSYLQSYSQRWLDLDLRLLWRCNRLCHRSHLRTLFSVISRLGDGLFWYGLIIVLAVAGGDTGSLAALHLLLLGMMNYLIYKRLKQNIVRYRPFEIVPGIMQGARALDRHSFPSGHTLHAVAFTAVAIYWMPLLALILVPFALLVALSRPLLGLHYPSDVAAGGVIGLTTALLSLLLLA
jgi:undecaprenyl-diphosphatase